MEPCGLTDRFYGAELELFRRVSPYAGTRTCND
jgi:hypothetical protein